MRSLNWISAKSLMSVRHEWKIWHRSNERVLWIKIHPLTGYSFYPVVLFLNILKLFIFIWDVMYYFCTVQIVVKGHLSWSANVVISNVTQKEIIGETIKFSFILFQKIIQWIEKAVFLLQIFLNVLIFYIRRENNSTESGWFHL